MRGWAAVAAWDLIITAPLGLRLPLKRPGIDDRPGSRDRLEEKVVGVDLDDHERLIAIEVRGPGWRGPRVAAPQLPAGADDEMGDAFLRHHPFVDVIVAG